MDTYADLGRQLRAVEPYKQTLPFRPQIGDKDGEAATLNNIGNVFFDLGDKPQFLELYEQALLLRHRMGDRWGESITGYKVAMVYQSLNRLDEAEIQRLEAVAVDEAIGHPELETDRMALEKVRTARCAQAMDSWPAP